MILNTTTIMGSYIFLSLCIMIFDFLSILTHRANTVSAQAEKRKKKMEDKMQKLIFQWETGRNRPDSMKRLRKKIYGKLKVKNGLMALNRLLESERLLSSDRFLTENEEVINHLCRYYSKKSIVYRVYFAYSLSLYRTDTPMTVGFLMDSVAHRSIYLRENSLKALYQIGNASYVAEALSAMNSAGIQHSQKLLSDGLLSFQGDQNVLSSILVERFQTFDEWDQVSIIDYLKRIDHGYLDFIFSLLQKADTPKEVRIAAIRYFSIKHYAQAGRMMEVLLLDKGNVEWEYRAVSALSLRNYADLPHTLEVLKISLRDPNWYVRYNSAESLLFLHADTDQILREETDRYARDILTYMKHKNELVKNGKEGKGEPVWNT